MPTCVYLDFWKGPFLKRKVLSWGFNADRLRVGRFRRLAGRSEFHADGAIKLKERSAKDFDFSKASRLRVGGCVVILACKAKLKSKTGVCWRSDSMQKLSFCTRCGIWQAANAVHSTGLCGLTSKLFFFLSRNKPFCSGCYEPNQQVE